MRVLALLCAGAAVISGGATAANGSGLYGKVVISPASPVCRQGVPCTRPAGHFVLRFARSGHVVATTRSHADGTYRVALAAGTYVVSTPAADSRLPRLWPLRAVVPRGRYVRIVFKLDVGIR